MPPMQADDLASTPFQLPVVLPCESIGAQAQSNTYDRNEQCTDEPTVHSVFSSSSTTRGASTNDSVIQSEIENFIFMSVLD